MTGALGVRAGRERVVEDRMDGQVALITGGGNGIGAGAARRLAGLGARVVIADIDEEAGSRVASEIDGVFVRCDVGELSDCREAVAAALDSFGGLDIAFLNAGVASGTDLADFDEDAYRRVMRVNLDGPVFGTVAAYPALVERGGGDLVVTASLAGLTGVPPDPLYAANKHAVVGLVRSLGPTWLEEGIRVNALCPGFTDTAIIDRVRGLLEAVQLPLLDVEDVVEALIRILRSERAGACWFVQPGRAPAPFEFRNLPGPRAK